MNANRFLTPEQCSYARGLYEQGISQADIARTLDKTQGTICKILSRFRETGSNQRKQGQGRPRKTTHYQDRFVRLQCTRQRFTTSTQLQTQFLNTYGHMRVCKQTIRNRLKEVQLRPYEAAIGPKLKPVHRRARLEYAREHVAWGEGEWANVLFSDESRFCLYSNDRRQKVFRRPGERFAQCNFKNTISYGGGSVMIWGGISLEAKTDLTFVERLTADRYITEILEEHVIPFAPAIGENFIFMHDNARPHTARIVQEYLADTGISVMNWPARSPDLNPIEHVWDHMKRQVRAEVNPPQTLLQLKQSLDRIWRNIDQDFIRNLILSMPRRCQEIINARGGNTRY